MAVGGEKEGKEKELLRIQWRSLSSPVAAGATVTLGFTVGRLTWLLWWRRISEC